jgi:hypothetical protein
MIAAGAERSEHGCSGRAHGEEHLLCAAVWSDDCQHGATAARNGRQDRHEQVHIHRRWEMATAHFHPTCSSSAHQRLLTLHARASDSTTIHERADTTTLFNT